MQQVQIIFEFGTFQFLGEARFQQFPTESNRSDAHDIQLYAFADQRRADAG